MSIIYFDTASTTKIDSRVFDSMIPYFTEFYGNASSSHEFGQKSSSAIAKSRKQVAELINSNENEIIFTSGATESINLALKGYVEANYDKGNHIITTKTEHKAVLATCEYLETKGVEITYLDVDTDGLISLSELEKSIRSDTILICIMHVNNETGIIQPIEKIGTIAKKNKITFFCDATQAVGKISIDVIRDKIDMLCFSGHKLNAPKGIGILYKSKAIEVTPLFHGGSQEKGMRPGTYNTPLIVGLGKACEIAAQEQEINYQLTKKIHQYITNKILDIKGTKVIGSPVHRIFNIIDFIIPGINAETFIPNATHYALSNGSACTSQIIESSHVLKAMGLTDRECNQTIRISIDHQIKESEVDEFIIYIKKYIK